MSEIKYAGADLLARRMSNDLQGLLSQSRRGRMAWRLMQIYTTCLRRMSRLRCSHWL